MKPKPKPVEEYLKLQNRFRHLSEEQIDYVQAQVDSKREWLIAHDGERIAP